VGSGGTWLIDPRNIVIGDFSGVSTNIPNVNPFTASGDSAELDLQDLIAAMTGGSNVTVSTGGGGSPGFQSGDITLQDPLSFDGTGNASLTLNADNRIFINAPITDSTIATPDSLDLTLNGRRGVLVSAGASIETQGGDVNIQSDGFATTGAGISINAPINSSDGDIDINGTGTNLGLALNAVINAGTGDLRLEGNSNNGSGLVIGPSGDLVVANDPSHIANIELFSNSVNGTGIALNQSIDTRGRNLTLNGRRGVLVSAGASIETQGGDVNIQSDGFATTGAGISINAPINSSDGDIDINGTGTNLGLALNAVINAGTGDLRLEGNSNNGSGLVIGPSGDLVVANDPSHIANIELFSNSVNGTGIALNQSIDTRGRNLTLNGRRGVLVSAGASIETQGGDVNIQSDGFATTGAGISINAPINSSDGDIDINGTGTNLGLALNAVINAGTGDLRLEGNSNNGSGLVIGPSGDLVVANDPSHIANIELFSNSVNGTGIALNQSIDTRGRNLTLNGRRGVLVSAGASIETQGGDVNIQSDGFAGSGEGVVVGGFIDASGGNISVQSLARLATDAIDILGSLSTNDGALISLEADGNINAGDITNVGGDINILSRYGNITTGIIDSSNNDPTVNTGNAGNITLETTSSVAIPNPDGRITTGLLLANSDTPAVGNGGDIAVTANGAIADIVTGNITTQSGAAGDGGDIVINTPGSINTVGGILSSIGATNGGRIDLEAGSDIDTADIRILLTSGFILNSGNIALTSTGGSIDTSSGDLITEAGGGNAGDISLDAIVGSLILGTVNAQSVSANGGALTFNTGQDITLTTGSVSTNDNDIAFNYDVNLAGDAEVNSFGTGNIIFNTPVDGAFDLSLNPGSGEVILNEVVGGNTQLNDFAFSGILRATIPSGFDINTNQITLLGDASIISNSGVGVTIDSPLDGFYNLSLDAGNGTLQLDAPIGRAVPLNTLTALDPIITSNPSGVSITTVNGLTTQAITAAGGIGLLSPNGPITTGDLNTSAIGSAGDVVLGTNGLATVRTINAQSTNGVGGDVEIIANSFFRATSTFTGQSGQPASISVAGASDGGTVSIRHGGNGITEFIVGSPISNGTSGAISRGATAIQNIASIQGFLNTYAQDSDRLQIISVPGSLPSVSLPINSSSTNSNNSNGNPQVTLAQNIGRRINATTYIDDTRDDGYAFEWTLPGGDDLSLDVDIPVVNLGLNPEDSVALVDELLEEDIEEHFDEEFSNTEVTAQSIRQSLTEIEAETGTRAVVLYVVSLPDSLELLLVTPEGNVLHSSVEEDATTRDQVIQRFLRTVSIPTHDFLIDLQLDDAPARQLYAWMIEPFAAYLKELNIDTLIFAMDAGLRSLPVAALHDGEKFLVEQYSLGLVPSFSLTDTRYQSLADANVLAMGISDFTAFGLEPLPSVPNELEVIEALWPGLTALNSEATLANLQTLRYQQEAEVIHLASHAAFVPGDPQNSHIQLWDTQLDMDGLRNLRWGDFPEVELLVLSACQTALGNVEAELGFAGLAVNSGVKSALASLWNVNDFSTQVLMHELYDQLHQAPTKAEALQEAQLAFLRGQLSPRGLETFQRGVGVVGRPNEGDSTTLPTQLGDLSHPYYWASFTMIGSPW
jgi:CHAT domain-containing protein